ncbi:MAG TPA: hypothetical protein VGO93_05015, partial [Candidatus Xenobia bacterium]
MSVMRESMAGGSYDLEIAYRDEDGIFAGRLLGTPDVVAFEGTTLDEVRHAFHQVLHAPGHPAGGVLAVLPRPRGLGNNRTFVAWMAVPWVVMLLASMSASVKDGVYQANGLPDPEHAPWATTGEFVFYLGSFLLMAARYRCQAVEDVSWKDMLRAGAAIGALAWLCPHPNSADMFLYVSD